MKNKKNGLILTIIIFLLVIGAFIFVNKINDTHIRSKNIPKTAIWKGGKDDGFWFDIVQIDRAKKTYRFKIYNEYDGDLVLDANFIKDTNCVINYPLNEQIIDKINYFNFDNIVMIDDCKLLMIKPAFGGTFWEIDSKIKK